jgi:hypothetical protein
MEMTSTLRQALAEALTEYTTNLDEVALIEAIASRALRQWLADEGLVVVPIHSTLQMDEAGSKEAQMAHAEGISVDAEVMWDFMIAAAPDALETKP